MRGKYDWRERQKAGHTQYAAMARVVKLTYDIYLFRSQDCRS